MFRRCLIFSIALHFVLLATFPFLRQLSQSHPRTEIAVRIIAGPFLTAPKTSRVSHSRENHSRRAARESIAEPELHSPLKQNDLPDPAGSSEEVEITHSIRPRYPVSEHESHRSGRVRLEVILEGANPESAEVAAVSSLESTSPDFEMAAREALTQFTFRFLHPNPEKSSRKVTLQFDFEAAY